MKFISPLFVVLPRKTKADKKCYLNLNSYRNWHHRISNEIKIKYTKQMKKQLGGVKFDKPVEMTFILYKASKRKTDKANILSVTEKFFCDALTHYKVWDDDNDDYLLDTHYKNGGVDRGNGRVEIIIT